MKKKDYTLNFVLLPLVKEKGAQPRSESIIKRNNKKVVKDPIHK